MSTKHLTKHQTKTPAGKQQRGIRLSFAAALVGLVGLVVGGCTGSRPLTAHPDNAADGAGPGPATAAPVAADPPANAAQPASAPLPGKNAPFQDSRVRAILPGTDCKAPQWPAPQGASPRCVIALERRVTAMGTSADGTVAVVSLSHGSTTAWGLPRGNLLRGLDPLGSEEDAQALVVDATMRGGDPVTWIAARNHLLRYDTGSGHLLARYEGPGGTIGALAVASGTITRLLVTAGGDGRAHLLDAEARSVRTLEGEGRATAVALDADARRAVVGDELGGVSLFDLAGQGPPRRLVPSLQPVAAVAFAGDNVLVAGGDGKLRVIDFGTATERAAVSVGAGLTRLAVRKDGSAVVSADRDNVIRVHALPEATVTQTLVWHRAGITALAWGAGATLVSSDASGQLALWSLVPAAPR